MLISSLKENISGKLIVTYIENLRRVAKVLFLLMKFWGNGEVVQAKKEFLKTSFIQKGDFIKAQEQDPGQKSGTGVMTGNSLYTLR